MQTCPTCGRPIPAGATACAACRGPGAAALDETLSTPPSGGLRGDPTISAIGGPPGLDAGATGGASTPASLGETIDQARFAPGTMLTARYRIVELLGRGGMGEVYRADDLTLRQPVAMKFLPEGLARRPERLEQFRHEVRVARQVAHPNLCRVYDIGEAGGQHFICMEYIDGENLASVLRRLGRPAPEKAIDIARQICIGLAAAHAKGVLHRDLKPHNIMIDGQGRVRIMDFGLAGFVRDFSGATAIAGTPAYMAPEQRERGTVSVQSDLYSMGLVFWELFTGRRPEVDSLATLTSDSLDSWLTPTDDIAVDPAVQRVIGECLQPDPTSRPASALAVAAGLPGSDLIGAALAAGQTPTPEMIAATGGSGHLAAWCGGLLLGWIVAALVLLSAIDSRVKLLGVVQPPLSSEVLVHRAGEICDQLGYGQGVDHASGFFARSAMLDVIERHDDQPRRWERLHRRPDALQFWYRQSPEWMRPDDRWGRIWEFNPPLGVPGMVRLQLTADGRLEEFQAVPPAAWPRPAAAANEADAPGALAAAPSAALQADWSALFEAAKLDHETFESAEPLRTPPVAFDQYEAWTGPYLAMDGVTLHIEAAALHGRPVYFNTYQTWSGLPGRASPLPARPFARIQEWTALVLLMISIVGAGWFGWRNLVRRRGDRVAAVRIALYYFGIAVITWLLWTHHVGSLDIELKSVTLMSAWALWGAALLGLLYMALEPTVREVWPKHLASWTRLLAGRLRDPLVGRDVLIGLAVGMVYAVLERLHSFALPWLGAAAPRPLTSSMDYLLGTRHILGKVASVHGEAIHTALLALFLFVIFKKLTRWTWFGAAALVVIGMLRMPYLHTDVFWWDLLFRAVSIVLVVGLMLRAGLLALAAAMFALQLLSGAALTFNLSATYGESALIIVGVIVLLSVYAWSTALRRSAFTAPGTAGVFTASTR